MNLDIALKILKEYYQENSKRHGLVQIGLFGSVAKGEADCDSDIDIVVRLEKPNLLELSAIQQELIEKFHTKVDIVRYRKKMNEFLKKRIDKEAIYV